MATFEANMVRACAIELREKIISLHMAVNAIYQGSGDWVLNSLDPDLPVPYDVRVKIAAYKALTLERLQLTDWVTDLLTAQPGDTLTYPPPPDIGGGTGLADGSSLADGTETAQ